jgi:hypothetical protein
VSNISKTPPNKKPGRPTVGFLKHRKSPKISSEKESYQLRFAQGKRFFSALH